MKKRQLSVFIFLVILLIVIGWIIFKTKKNITENETFEARNPLVDMLRDNLVLCLKDASEASVSMVTLQGGYYNKPQFALELPPLELADDFGIEYPRFIPYYYNQGKLLIPSNEEVEKQISQGVNENLLLCISNLSYEFEISYEKPRTETILKEKEVEILTSLPLKIHKESIVVDFDLNITPIKIPSRLKSMLELASNMTLSRKENPKLDCVSCLERLAEKKDLYLEITNFDETTTLTTIYTNYTGKLTSFLFLNKFTKSD